MDIKVTKLEFESQNEFNDWVMNRLSALQYLIMNGSSVTSEDIDKLHLKLAATLDQKRAEMNDPRARP